MRGRNQKKTPVHSHGFAGGALVSGTEARPVSVLLVDSPEVTRKQLRAVLEREPGLRVVAEAHSQSSCMRMFFDHRPDVVVVGVCLEESSGFDVLVCIRQADSRCPLILVGETQDTFVEHVGRLYGANEVCYKDENFDQILEVLQRLVSLRKPAADN